MGSKRFLMVPRTLWRHTASRNGEPWVSLRVWFDGEVTPHG